MKYDFCARLHECYFAQEKRFSESYIDDDCEFIFSYGEVIREFGNSRFNLIKVPYPQIIKYYCTVPVDCNFIMQVLI